MAKGLILYRYFLVASAFRAAPEVGVRHDHSRGRLDRPTQRRRTHDVTANPLVKRMAARSAELAA